jgi:predicted amidophosphoribosyltransferase
MFCARCDVEFTIYCTACDKEVDPDAVICPHCGEVLEEEVVDTTTALSTDSVPAPELEEKEAFTGQCPVCETPLFIEDGFCPECGTTLCGRCGQQVDEDDEICPHCQTPLFFECPSCQFELTAGTDICPNCNTLFPAFCSRCHTSLLPGMSECPDCKTAVHTSQRQTARVLHTIMVEKGLVRVVACTDCGTHFNPVDGGCPTCGYRVCPACQISLEADEKFCPRCGVGVVAAVCPACHNPIPSNSDECPHCQQLLCPACQAAVAEDDLVCPQCGAEFELVCPVCETAVSSDAVVCPACGEDL